MQKPEQEKMVWKDRYENDPNVPPLYYWYPNELGVRAATLAMNDLFAAHSRAWQYDPADTKQ